MIAGTVTIEDIIITFFMNADNTVTYTVCDMSTQKCETLRVNAKNFFSALSIAIHHDGMPNADRDYPDAESVLGKIRWIP